MFVFNYLLLELEYLINLKSNMFINLKYTFQYGNFGDIKVFKN